jgi:hypothetical protein
VRDSPVDGAILPYDTVPGGNRHQGRPLWCLGCSVVSTNKDRGPDFHCGSTTVLTLKDRVA